MRPSVITTSTRHRYKKPTSCCSNIPSFHLLHFPVSHPFILHPPDRLRELADTHFSLLLPPSLFFCRKLRLSTYRLHLHFRSSRLLM